MVSKHLILTYALENPQPAAFCTPHPKLADRIFLRPHVLATMPIVESIILGAFTSQNELKFNCPRRTSGTIEPLT